MEGFRFLTKNKINDLPKTAGVYLFRAGGKTIYIGKAINIIDRVKNHFYQPSYRDDLFINKVNKIGFFETNSEIEALILEASLIKKYQPKYNVVWRDDKNYFYVALHYAQGKLPYIYVTHQPSFAKGFGGAKKNKKAEYIGPFVEGIALKKTLRFLRRVFPYYTSAKHPKTKCTWCHLDLCPGPRLFEARLASPNGEAAKLISDYRKNIKKLILILRGKRSAVLSSLKKEMKILSKKNKFEEAGKIRDRIYNLQQVMSHTHVLDASTLAPASASNSSYSSKYAIAYFERKLNLQNLERIECYDVSNIQGKFATGSMVVFTGGRPDKSQYKKFKIRAGNTPNDIAMLKETITRRLAHPEWPYPDAMLIDGGKAQLNVAINSKGKANIKTMAMAKGRQELFIEGPPSLKASARQAKKIPLKSLPQEAHNLIKQLDDEAHRFAIAYHKKLRKKSLLDK